MAQPAGAKAIQRSRITKSTHESLGSTIGNKITSKQLSHSNLDNTTEFSDSRKPATNLQAVPRNGEDDRFKSSMRLSRELDGVTSSHPLHVAISKGSEIDVQIILDVLGPSAVASIQWSDCEGRTALHIATLSGNKKITEVLLNHYRSCEGRQLSEELIALEEEFREITAKVLQQSIDYLYTYRYKPLSNFMKRLR